MNIREEHQDYKHFEAWVSEYIQIDSDTARLSLSALVRIYIGIFPGRTDRLMTSLIQVARMWTEVYDREKLLTELNKGLTHHPECADPIGCHPDCAMGNMPPRRG